MAGRAPWRHLACIDQPDDISTLLVNSTFGSNSYSIQVTDMAGSLWSADASRKEIVKQSINEETSLDASDGPENMRAILEKIESALAGDLETTCRFISQDDKTLHLELSAPVTDGIKDLVWQLRLQSSSSAFVSDFIQPLLQANYIQHESTKELTKLLRDKDHVIDSLCSRLEASGMDVSTVFPGVKTTKRHQAEAHIKGLKPFDEAQWRKSLASDARSSVSMHDMIAAMGASPGGGSGAKQAPASGSAVPSASTRDRPSTPPKATTKAKAVATSARPAGDDDDDDFQRQDTPPSARKIEAHWRNAPSPPRDEPNASKNSEGVVDESATDDEDDLDAPISSRAVSHASPARKSGKDQTLSSGAVQQNKKLGMLGGRKKPEQEKAPSPPPAPELAVKHREDRDDATDVEDDDDLDKPAKSPVKKAVPSQDGAPKRSKLGVIGGRKAAAPHASGTTSKTDNTTTPEPREAPREQNGSTNVSLSAQKDDAAQSAADEAAPKSSQDRADERRLELKRQLESSKPAAKKKRRF